MKRIKVFITRKGELSQLEAHYPRETGTERLLRGDRLPIKWQQQGVTEVTKPSAVTSPSAHPGHAGDGVIFLLAFFPE